MTSPEPAPPADPTSYRKRGFGWKFWALMAFTAACIVGGVIIGLVIPKIFPANDTAAIGLPAMPWTTTAEQAADAGDDASAPSPGAAPAPNPEPAAPPPTDLAGLSRRVEQLEADEARTTEAARAVLAASALLQAAQTSRPFTTELSAVEHLLPANNDVSALKQLAETGAPTRAVLAADYPAAAARAAAAATKPGEGASLVAHIRYALASIVTIRRVDYTEGKGAGAVLARAEVLVQDGDLERAMDELAALPPHSRQAMADWIERAARRIELDRHLAAVRASALKSLNLSAGGRPA